MRGGVVTLRPLDAASVRSSLPWVLDQAILLHRPADAGKGLLAHAATRLVSVGKHLV